MSQATKSNMPKHRIWPKLLDEEQNRIGWNTEPGKAPQFGAWNYLEIHKSHVGKKGITVDTYRTKHTEKENEQIDKGLFITTWKI